MVNNFYDLVTDFYEYGWCGSDHISTQPSPSCTGVSPFTLLRDGKARPSWSRSSALNSTFARGWA